MLSIIIPAKNESRYLGSCLHALQIALERYGGNFEIILVDNGSTDSTRVIAEVNDCKVIEEPASTTISRLRNKGAQRSEGEIIAFIDADCVVSPTWVVRCLEALNTEKIAVVGTRAIPKLDDASWVEKAWYKLMSGARRPDFPEWIGTSNLFVRKADFLCVGGFDETLETAEDVNLCYAIRMQGKLIYLEQQVNTIHLRESKTLRELFKREYWRGKSTIRSFLKKSFHLKELPSLLLPLVNLLIILSAIALLALGSIYSILPLALMVLIPTAVLIKKQVDTRSIKQLWQCYMVALVYIFARSCSFILELKDLYSTTLDGKLSKTSWNKGKKGKSSIST